MVTENTVQEQSGGEETTGTNNQEVVKQPEKVSGDKPSDAEAQLKALLEKVEAIEKALEGKEQALRAFQSEKDKAMKSAKQEKLRADSLEKLVENLRKGNEDDPEFLSRLDRGELDWRRSSQKDQEAMQQMEVQRWQANIQRELNAMGITPAHPNFVEVAQAARTAKSSDEATQLILAKAREVKAKENNTMSNDTIAQLKKEIQEGLKGIRKDLGLDSDETLPPTGQGGKVYTSEMVANMSPEEYKKNEPEIDRAIREGRFKK